MMDNRPTEAAGEDRRETKRAWSDPTIEATPIADAEGSPHPPPSTDGITNVS